MPNADPRIDAYIEKSAGFAKPILLHFRELVHKACPGVEETIKWGFPHFDYKGMMCSMAAFKQHCAVSFWKASHIDDPHGILAVEERSSMGHSGQLKSLSDLPSDKILLALIKDAKRLNDEKVKAPLRTKPEDKKELEIPEYFMMALQTNKAVWKTFEAFSNSNKREYVEWVTEAKTDETRDKRLATAVEWMAEGKVRNWKYVKKGKPHPRPSP